MSIRIIKDDMTISEPYIRMAAKPNGQIHAEVCASTIDIMRMCGRLLAEVVLRSSSPGAAREREFKDVFWTTVQYAAASITMDEITKQGGGDERKG